VRPLRETPTDARHYALLTGTYGALLGGVVATARRRGSPGIERGEVPVLAAATFALSKTLVHEKVDTWLREPFVDEDEQADARRPKGRGLRYAVGELLTCTRCTGAWSALALVGLRVAAPEAGRVVVPILAASAGNDFAHAAFTGLCNWSERQRADRHAEEPGLRPVRAGYAHGRGSGR
jgi:Protein of unknown function (DUF1360)